MPLFTWVFHLLILLSPTGSPDDKIAASLLEAGIQGRSEPFIIVLAEQADLRAVDAIHGKVAKADKTMRLLVDQAQRTQGPLLAFLADEGAPARPFYLVNAIVSHGDLALMRRLAERPDVAAIVADSPVAVADVREEGDAVLRNFESVTWGIARIQADSVWAMGYTGQGVVIGGQDTGYEWDHPALIRTYRGSQTDPVDHNYNWHDAIHELNPLNGDTTSNPLNNPCGLDSATPCDDHNHGTHTMGTMAGIDSSNQIGVAPGATWIGCRNMERGWGMPSTYIECFEWFLAPTDLNGENPDPEKAPQVINNSWGCPTVEGCDPSNFALMEMAVDNLRTAGTVVVVSAGNSGPGCSSVDDPSAIFESSFSIGAMMANDTIAGFSSRGPVTVDGSMRLKPDVTAPGVGVRSCIRNGKYASFSGTSMAGPHVAGAVALILSARPDLAGEVDVIEELLESTARVLMSTDTCGGIPGTQVPNTTYGWGRINVFDAVRKALENSGVSDPFPDDTPGIWPNPFQEGFEISWSGTSSGTAEVLLTDLSGRPVLYRTFRSEPGATTHVDVPGLTPGFYTLYIRQNGRVHSRKLIHY